MKQTTLPTTVALSVMAVCTLAADAPVATPERARGQEHARPIADEPGRPNIVLILADDLGWNDLGCYGNPDVKTPNLDRLAAEGLRFTQAFGATPVCGPARTQIQTGLLPIKSRSVFNHPRHLATPGATTIPAALKALGYRVGAAGKLDVGPIGDYPYEMLSSDRSASGGDALRGFVERDADQPFFLYLGSGDPHVPWTRNTEKFDPVALTLPPHFVDTPETRECLADYYADVSLLDQQVGEVLEMIESSGLAERTLVVFSSEHGAEFPRGKHTLYDLGIKTALLARWPGRVEPGSTCAAIVQSVDLLPTFVALAGGKPESNWDGKSIAPLLRGEGVVNHEYAYGVNAETVSRSVRDTRWKYIRHLDHEVAKPVKPFVPALLDRSLPWHRYVQSWIEAAKSDPAVARRLEWFTKRPPEELFDTENDPFEMNNLADDPAHGETLARLRAACDRFLAEQGDNGTETVNEIRAWQDEQRAAGKKYWMAAGVAK